MAGSAEHDRLVPHRPGNPASAAQIELWILSRMAELTGEQPGAYGADTEFAAVGLSSKDAVLLTGELQDYLGRPLTPMQAWDYPCARALAHHLASAPGAAAAGARRPAVAAARPPAAAPIAVVGMACRFPGAPSADAFWSLLESGRDGLAAHSDRRPRRPHGLLSGIDQFDAAFFALSDLEADHVDPQQRLLLEAAWEALEDAAIAPTSLAGSRTGVFAGITGSDYGRLQTAGTSLRSRFSGTGEALSIVANRLSYLLDLRGPSLAVDTACSSSLVAVHLAVRSLRSGESDLALAGGVNILLAPEITDILAEAGTMAPDGRCKTFDASADGYVRSEGCGLVVLKRLSDAAADGDRVLGVIKGSAVGQEGRTNGLTAPSGLAQRAVLRAALHDAQMEPGDIGYLEAHGTGTALGDPIEVAAQCAVYGEARDADRPLLLGSVKANIGHAEAAAGIAGLIKVLLMLAHRRVPGQIHLRSLNPRLPAGAPIRITRTSCDWPATPGRALAAGVSSFGFGGTIAHVIVAEPPPARSAGDEAASRPCHLLALSAGSQAALAELAGRYAGWLREHPGADLGAVARTTTLGRAHLRHRAALAARTQGEAVAGLDALASGAAPGASPAAAHRGQARPAAGRLAMLFSGGGSQYLNMGRQLYVTNALFRDQLRHCQELLAGHLDVPLLSVLFPLPPQRDLLDRIRYTQPALVAVGYALAQVWRSWGVVADLVLGHSTGEFTAACVAGVLDLADGLRLVAERGRLFEEFCEPGSMATVFAAEELVRDAAAGMPGDRAPTIAAVNAPDAVVVAGRPADLASFLEKLSERGVASRPMKADHAYHSPMMLPAAEPFARAVSGLAVGRGAIGMVSDLDGRIFADGYRPDGGYWVRQLTEPVRFAEGIRQLVQQGCSQFVEVGPGRSLVAAGQRAFPDALWVSSLRPGAGDWAMLTDAVARLYTAGRDIDWAGFHRGGGQDRLGMPGYPFERRRHWLPSAPDAVPVAADPGAQGRPAADERARRGTEHRMESYAPAAAPVPSPALAATEPVLARLSGIVAALLGRQLPVDPDTPFLELGADSMALFQLLQTVQKTFGVAIGVSSVFDELNTLNRLAEHILGSAPAAELAALPLPPAAGGTRPGGHGDEPGGAPSANGAAATGPAVPNRSSLPPGPAGGPEVGQFLRVHAQVMSQAYELLRGAAADDALPGATGPSAPGMASHGQEPTVSGAHGQAPAARQDLLAGRIAMTGRETFVPFRTDWPTEAAGLTDAQGAFARQLVQRFAARTRRSGELAEAERRRHSDVRHALQAFPDLKQIRYPVVADRSLGARVWDVDGNEYIDLTMGFGVNLFGHQEPFIVSAITEQLAEGIQLGPHSPLAGEVAQLVCDMTGQQRVVFCNTGSEAVMVAIRLARAVTGRRRIALFAGAYHGSADPVLAQQDLGHGSGEAVPMAPGITEDISRNALVLPYGDDASLDVLRAYRDELAAVLVEPVQSRRPDLQPIPFLGALRELTQAAGIPLIFDEIVTGFRVHPGGVQALLGIRADITTYGKVLGGGLPIGLVAGDARYLNAIDGGTWQPGGSGQRGSVRTFFTGTFAKHPLALAAARAVLTELKDRGPSLQESLTARTENLARRLGAALNEAGVAAQVGQFGSLFRFRFVTEPPWSRAVELFYTALLDKGLYIWEGRNCFLSTAHTDADLDEIVSAVARTAAEMAAAGFFGAHRAAIGDRVTAMAGGAEANAPAAPDGWPLSRVQQEIWALDRLGPDHSRAYTEGVLLDLRGELDLEALREAVAEVLARHDSLHAVIAADGSRQRVVPPVAHLPLVDLTGTGDEQRRRMASWLEAQASEVLDVTAGPPVRAAVLRSAADHHRLYLAVHHIMIDGWSFGVVASEIAELYAGRLDGHGTTLPEPAQYSEHVAWEQQRQESPAWEAGLRYWQAQYADGVPELILPASRPRPATPSHRLGVVRREIGRPTADQLPGASGRLSVTPFAVLLAAYGCLLHRLSGQDDLVIGVPFACRGYPGGEGVVGHCSTTLPVRSRLSPGTRARDYIGTLQAALVGGHEHPEFSADMLPEQVRAGGDAGWGIFAAQFNLDRLSALRSAPGLQISVSPVPKHFAKACLLFDVLLADGDLWLSAEYDADLFDQGAAEAHVDMFERLLGQFIAEPDAVLDAPVTAA
ncbi:MAG TPA: aminotransferase class III-fold pyridoxal phosphate-dependent enzyme [Streptosporangiaceae bacterium]|nr:aminotransferase class III-fold pyridoxal phosphate-dependent enzyme [Streptosporangiaceae bacterium]